MANKKLNTPVNVPVEKIRPFEGHPYKVLDNEEMNEVFYHQYSYDLLKTQMNMK